jgi:glucose/arabinose dehydrogenase
MFVKYRKLSALVPLALALGACIGGLAYWFGSGSDTTLQLQTTRLDVRVLLRNLEIPWDMDWSEDGWIWFSQKNGKISRYRPDTGELQEILIIDEVFQSLDNSGLHALALHPQFPQEPHVYVHYTYAPEFSRLVRFRFNAATASLDEKTVLLDKLPASVSHNGSRIVFSPGHETMFFALGDAFNPKSSQDLGQYSGKILRMNLDGSVPDDNPFPGSLVWSYGHRNPQGLVMAGNGRLYSSEHGGSRDDELNLIERGQNYGHPLVRGFCDNEEEEEFCTHHQTTEPLRVWSPTFGVAGIAYYNQAAIPEWQNSILLTSLKNPRDREGKRLQVLKLNKSGDRVVEVEDYLVKTFGRLREVMVAPDGRIFLFTSNREINWNKPRIPRFGDDKLIMLQVSAPTTPP